MFKFVSDQNSAKILQVKKFWLLINIIILQIALYAIFALNITRSLIDGVADARIIEDAIEKPPNDRLVIINEISLS